MADEIVNRIARSPLVTLDLEDFYQEGTRSVFDLKECLHEGIILREKDFRDFVKKKDWTVFKDQHVGVICSVDAIIPYWAYMLIASKLSGIAKTIILGDLQTLEDRLIIDSIRKMDLQQFEGKKIIIKGCGKLGLSEAAYVEVTNLLVPHAQSIMYGEPCSTVPVYKKMPV